MTSWRARFVATWEYPNLELPVKATHLLCAGMLCLLLGCGPGARPLLQTTPANAAPILVTRAEQVKDAVGQLVTLQGEVGNSKIPTILGVDVESFDPDLRGQQATATGILRQWTVTREQLDKEKGVVSAGRGPGTYYRLVNVDSDETVQVQPLP